MIDAPESVLTPGTVFQNGYEILSPLGGGAFGWVYRARQLSTGQDVAIKVLRVRADCGPAENQQARFRREMRLCAELSHPNIVRLIDSGEAEGGLLYAVLEYVPGATLKEVLTAEGKLDVREAVHLMTQVLDALGCAHARGVVHRDLKPENIMITKTGVRRNALVLDFGLGGFAREMERVTMPRLTATQELMGTPCYAAPEQLRGEPPTTRSDLYSWGLVFLECLTGELAVHGGSGHDVIMRQLGPEPVPIPATLRKQRLGRLLQVVTAKQVEKRDVTIETLFEALGAIAHERVPEASSARQLPDGVRRQLTVVSVRIGIAPVDARTLDLEEIDELLHAQHGLVADVAALAGGRVASVLADRVVLAFGHPAAREDDPRRAARAALAIVGEIERGNLALRVERGVRVETRVGVHTGLVIVRELRQGLDHGLFDLIGPTPQIAARLDERAEAGEVLASSDTERLLRDSMLVEAAGELPLAEHSRPISCIASPHASSGPASRRSPAARRRRSSAGGRSARSSRPHGSRRSAGADPRCSSPARRASANPVSYASCTGVWAPSSGWRPAAWRSSRRTRSGRSSTSCSAWASRSRRSSRTTGSTSARRCRCSRGSSRRRSAPGIPIFRSRPTGCAS
jgi:serine/threonine protein kinase